MQQAARGTSAGRTSWAVGLVAGGMLAVASPPWAARALVSLVGCAGGDFGDDCSVAELVAGGSVQVDNSVFDAWTYLENGIPATAIRVTPLGEGTTDPGPGVRLEAPGLGADASVDFEMNYDVSTADSSASLTGYRFVVDLGQITGAAGAFAATEVVDNDSGKEIACGGLGGAVLCEEPVPDQNDPVRSDRFTDEDTGLDVLSKDLNANTNMMAFTGSGESLEFIALEQSFSIPGALGTCGDGVVDLGETCDDGNTTPGDGCDAACMTEVPEPGAWLLLLTGALVLLGAHRLRTERASAPRQSGSA